MFRSFICSFNFILISICYTDCDADEQSSFLILVKTRDIFFGLQMTDSEICLVQSLFSEFQRNSKIENANNA
jgi:hypothetical protein